MPALDRSIPVKCTNCEKMIAKLKMARHKKSCDSGTLSCPKCPNFFTKKKEDLNYHLAKHHAPKDVKLSAVCAVCLEGSQAFILFNNTRGESMEIPQQLEPNRVISSKKS